jgi:sortase (surface protein transpeptidase)
MKELEKGVIRYPGSAKPGEDGASFIFGHSSNFPWIK